MAPRQSIIRSDSIEFSGWLIIDKNGGMKLSRGSPTLRPNERAVAITVKVPTAIFRTPALRATITIPPDTSPPVINAETVASIEDALKAGTGMEFSVTVEPPATS